MWLPGGEKRNVIAVFEDGGLWHRLHGAVPEQGARLQCHIDPDRRDETSRAHTALHLLIHSWPRAAGALVAHPEVRGGGHIRIETDAPHVAPDTLASWRDQVQQHIQADHPIRRSHVTDVEVTHRLTPQPFHDEVRFPGPDTTREAVRIDAVGALPCDGTHAARTGAVGSVVLAQRNARRGGGTVLVWRVR